MMRGLDINKNYNREGGFVLILFLVLLPVLLGLIGLAVDTASLYSASLKANSAAEAAVTSAILARIKETDPVFLPKLNLKAPAVGGNTFESDYIKARAETNATSILLNSGILAHDASLNNADRSVQINTIGTGPAVKATLANDVLTLNVGLKVPTLLLHYVPGFASYAGKDLKQRANSQTVNGQASVRIKGANYLFVLDLSNSQACPAGTVTANPDGSPVVYCKCNSSNKLPIRNGAGNQKYIPNYSKKQNGAYRFPLVGGVPSEPQFETCQEEANRVSGALRGKIRVDLTIESLIKALDRLDQNRDRLSIIGFNTVGFTVIPFNDPPSGKTKAAPGFIINDVKDKLRQIQSVSKATAKGPPTVVRGVPVIVPEGMTNLSDGFITAYQEAKAAGLTKDRGERFNVIYYSDGGATAMRASFNSVLRPSYNDPGPGKNPLPERAARYFTQTSTSTAPIITPANLSVANTYKPLVGASNNGWVNDYLNYNVILKYTPKGSATQYFQAYSPIVDSAQYKNSYIMNLMNMTLVSQLGKTLPLEPYGKGDVVTDPYSYFNSRMLPSCYCGQDGPPTSTASCSPRRPIAPIANASCDPTDTAKYKSVNIVYRDTCTNLRTDLLNKCTGNTGKLDGSIIDLNNTDPELTDKRGEFTEKINVADMLNIKTSTDFRYLYYISALEAAELLRNNGGKINAIGYGATSTDLLDPAQGLDDVSGLKEGFMANLTSSYEDLLRIYGKAPNQLGSIPQFNKSNQYSGYQDIKSRKDAGVGAGSFLTTTDPTKFEHFLSELINQIRMKVQNVS